MNIYVDDLKLPYGRMKMSHMTADTIEELHQMAAQIGLKRAWFQAGSDKPHYDVCQSKRALAVKFGAVEVGARTLLQKAKTLGQHESGMCLQQWEEQPLSE